MVTRASERFAVLKNPPWQVFEDTENARQAEARKKGRNPIAFFSSDPPKYGFLNQEISQYLIDAAEKGVHGYDAPVGELVNAICGWEKKYRNVEYVRDDIIPTQGVAGGWFLIHYSMLDPYAGDEVCVLEPAHYCWTPLPVLESFHARAIPVPCSEKEGWQPDVDTIRKKINDKTKFIVIDNPSNPTGAVCTENRLKEIADIAGENDVAIVSDEMYSMIAYDGLKVKSMADIARDVPVIVMNGMSKFFMRTGWRVGYLAFHDPEGKITEIKKTIRSILSLYGHPALRTSPIIYAAAKAYAGTMEGGFGFVSQLQQLRDYVMKRLGEIEGLSCTKPSAALYIFPHIHGIGEIWKTDEEFMVELNKEEDLIFAPGNWFGPSGFGHFRGLLTASKEMHDETWNRLERFLRRHTT